MGDSTAKKSEIEQENKVHNLIISEKNSTARKIAQILSNGKYKTEKSGKYPIYTWEDNGTPYRCFGLRGHILKVDFPEEYRKWEDVDLKELAAAEVEKKPIQKSLLRMIEREAKKANKLIIATDFDREGELIGVDAQNIASKANREIEAYRARFSALTKEEINEAFSNLEKPYLKLAEAGGTRQEIDLVWGATLTRFLSLTSGRRGNQYLSVGRVQSPTLSLVVKREKEIRAFKPKTYYQIKAVFNANGNDFTTLYSKTKIMDKKGAEKIVAELKETGVISKYKEKVYNDNPPVPFNTTEFLAAVSKAGISPSNAMRTAEYLYSQGFVSYPRVDNTVYPKSLDLRGIVSNLEGFQPVSEYIKEKLKDKKLSPTRGKKQTTDHPPIHPTGEIPGNLGQNERKVYQLIVRRFLATVSEPARRKSKRIKIDNEGYEFFAKGFEYTELGYLEIYGYDRKSETVLPDVRENDEARLINSEILEKQTKPRGRYSQAGLIKQMEKLGLGTKATRHSIIQNLYNRGYIVGNPVQPTELGIAVAETLEKHMEKISTSKMTSELEMEMDEIEEGKKRKPEVVGDSRELLLDILKNAESKKEEVTDTIWSGVRRDRTVGKCPECGGEIIVRRSKRKKRFLGCSNYPDCKTSYPIPQRGGVYGAGKNCNECGAPKVQIIKKGRRPWEFCPNPECPTSNLNKNNRKKSKNDKR